jgi:serine/threonine protein kinase
MKCGVAWHAQKSHGAPILSNCLTTIISFYPREVFALQQYETRSCSAGETGSYRYMAPEVFLHEPYNTKVDVYSFAMICYQLFEGAVPFEGTDPVQAARNAAMHRQRPIFSALPNNAANKNIYLVCVTSLKLLSVMQMLAAPTVRLMHGMIS